MARTQKHVIDRLAEQLAAVLNVTLTIEKHCPGDGCTYSVDSDGRHMLGSAVMTWSELEVALRAALCASEIASPTAHVCRLNGYWERRNSK